MRPFWLKMTIWAVQILSLVASFLIGQHRAEVKARAEFDQYRRDRARGAELYQKSVQNQGRELEKWRLNP